MLIRTSNMNDLATRMIAGVDGEPAIDVCCAAAMVVAYTLHVGFKVEQQETALNETIEFLRRIVKNDRKRSRN